MFMPPRGKDAAQEDLESARHVQRVTSRAPLAAASSTKPARNPRPRVQQGAVAFAASGTADSRSADLAAMAAAEAAQARRSKSGKPRSIMKRTQAEPGFRDAEGVLSEDECCSVSSTASEASAEAWPPRPPADGMGPVSLPQVLRKDDNYMRARTARTRAIAGQEQAGQNAAKRGAALSHPGLRANAEVRAAANAAGYPGGLGLASDARAILSAAAARPGKGLLSKLRATDAGTGEAMSLLQLPTRLPWHESLSAVRSAHVIGQASAPAPVEGKSEAELFGTRRNDPHQFRQSFAALPEGKVGKLRVWKSGHVSMTIGGVEFDIMHGTPVRQAMQAAAIKPVDKPEEQPEAGPAAPAEPLASSMSILGSVTTRLIATPNIHGMLPEWAEARGLALAGVSAAVPQAPAASVLAGGASSAFSKA